MLNYEVNTTPTTKIYIKLKHSLCSYFYINKSCNTTEINPVFKYENTWDKLRNNQEFDDEMEIKKHTGLICKTQSLV